MDMRGRWPRWNKKSLVQNYLALDMAKISKQTDLEQSASYTWVWRRTDATTAPEAKICVEVHPNQGLHLSYSYAGESISPYLVPITTTQPYYGGKRYWFLCPKKTCQRRVRVLYAGKHFLCRHCQNLTYATAQTGGKLAPAIENRLAWLGRRLGIRSEVWEGLPAKPLGMHRDTYMKLTREYLDLLRLREQALAIEIFDLCRDLDLGGDLPPIPSDFRQDLVDAWKAHKAQHDSGELS